MSDEAFRNLTRHHGWEFVLPQVILAPGYPDSGAQRLKALELWGSPFVAISYLLAAAWLGMTGFGPARSP